ncbi:MAG: antitoxin [Erysipelotrichaceae bacterium]|nr:antitoxin [Erysipelotrichaceae bacterium]
MNDTLIEKVYTNVYTKGVKEANIMETAKLFTNGGSQAVRLPKNCRFDDEEVYVNKIGNAVILLPKNDPWSSAVMGLSMFSDDFMKNYEDLPVEERDSL